MIHGDRFLQAAQIGAPAALAPPWRHVRRPPRLELRRQIA